MPTLALTRDLGAGELERRGERVAQVPARCCAATSAMSTASLVEPARSARRIRNSSPLWRATMSPARTAPRSRCGHLDQELVAGAVAEAVVHELEVVEVDVEHGDAVPVGAPRAPGRPRDAPRKVAVREARQRVVVGEVREPLLGELSLGDVEQVALAVERLAGRVAHDHRLVVHPHHRPVGPHDAVLADERGAVDPGGLEPVEHAATVVLVDDLGEEVGILLPLRMRIAGDDVVLRAVVERRSALVERIDVDGERQLLDERAVAVLGIAEGCLRRPHGLLGLLARGDLPHHAVDLVGTAAVGRHGDGLVVEPARPPGHVDHPVLERERLTVLDRPPVRRDGSVAIVGVDPGRPCVGIRQPLGRRHADHGVDLRAHVDRLARARPIDVRDHRDLLDERPEAARGLHQLLVPARVLDRGADDLAKRPPVLHPAGCKLGGRCAVDLDHADGAVGSGQRKDEEGGRPKRPARADDRELRRVVGERPLGAALAHGDEPPRAVVHEPDEGLAAGQLGSAGRERPRDLVELERRREVTGKLEQGLLTAGGHHLAFPIGRAAAVLERMPASGRRGAPEAPKRVRPARSPSARRGTSGRWEACGGSSRRTRNRRSGSPRAPRAPRTSCRSQRRLQCSSHDPRVELLPQRPA